MLSPVWLRAVSFDATDRSIEDASGVWGGSGTLLRIPDAADVLITARHCVAFPTVDGPRAADELDVKFLTLPEGSRTVQDIVMTDVHVPVERFIEHPTNREGGLSNPIFKVPDGQGYDFPYPWVDVVAIALDPDLLRSVSGLQMWEFSDLIDLKSVADAPGQPISILGFPQAYWSVHIHHHALARSGFLASPLGNDIQGYPVFMIDSLTHLGMSGGPVVWSPAELGTRGPKLAGVYVATHEDYELSYAIHAREVARMFDDPPLGLTPAEMRATVAT